MDYFYNIGEKQAAALKQKLINMGLMQDREYTIDEYKQILKSPEIFSQLPIATQTDLTYNPLRVIPREYIQLIETELMENLKIKFKIAGSYIRGKPTSSDIDMVVVREKNMDMWQTIINVNSDKIRFIKPFAHGNDKIATLINIIEKKVYVKVDIFLCNPENYVFTLLFAIGSGRFNVRMRSVAKRKGCLLNNNGLYLITKNGLQKINVTTEKQVFKYLGMIYREPAERVF